MDSEDEEAHLVKDKRFSVFTHNDYAGLVSCSVLNGIIEQ